MTQKRSRRSAGAQGVQLGLIITPMLDMSFQLLAFFIMTYHPSALEAHIPGRLAPPDNPALDRPQQAVNPLPEAPMPADPDQPEIFAATVKIKAIVKGQEIGNRVEGGPSQIFIKLPLETEARLVADVDVDFETALKLLDAELKDLARKETIGRTNLKIAADGELRQQFVIGIYDITRKAGFEKIHFVPPSALSAKLK
jgi:biopolymer transport protein ExbD